MKLFFFIHQTKWQQKEKEEENINLTKLDYD